MSWRLDRALEDVDSFPYIVEQPFWEYVDTDPRWDQRPRNAGETWAEERVSEQCMAMTTQGTRCSMWISGSPRAPFCSRHIEKAVQWFLALAGEVTLRQHRSAMRDLEAERAAYLATAAALTDASTDGRVSQVYFYHLPEANLVKIGTSINVALRITSFAKGQGCTWPEGASPEGGHLIGTIPGGRQLEGALHRRFYPHRIRGTEWFHYEPLSLAIAALLEPSEEIAS